MRIENEILLDYSDVLIRPKRSTLGSRKEVDLERQFTFCHGGLKNQGVLLDDYDWSGVPIIASNMDGVGTMELADQLATGNIITGWVKPYSAKEILSYFKVGTN